jgi:hypothetical protein
MHGYGFLLHSRATPKRLNTTNATFLGRPPPNCWYMFKVTSSPTCEFYMRID